MRRGVLSVTVAIGLVLAAEFGVRAIATHLPEPLMWGDREAQNKAARMDVLDRRSEHASVVFMGSSNMNYAANPQLLARLTGARRPAFNAALNGADLRSLEFWTTHVVVPRLHPQIVVLGTTSRELNDRGITGDNFYRTLIQSAAARRITGSRSGLDRIQASIERHSYLARYRTELRRPADLMNGGDPRVADERVDRWGLRLNRHSFQGAAYSIPPQFRRSSDFSIGGPQLRALDHIAGVLEKQNVLLVLVKMPVTNDFTSSIHHRHPYRQYERTLDRFLGSHSAVFVDAAARISDRSLFVDPIHLNAIGMRRFTELLTPVIKDLVDDLTET